MKILLLLTVLLPYASLQSTKDSTHYVAAVVEFSPAVDPKTGLTGTSELLQNLQNYEQLIATAKGKGADIIVFPEVGLEGILHREEREYYEVPDPKDSVSPCRETKRWEQPIWRMSCAARTHQIYVVVNIHEEDGANRYNTNIVFDRNGVVVSRYRKSHLFNEPGLQVPEEDNSGVFETDFGVTFGVAICFDLLFREPASELVHSRDIRHFVYSTAWYSELPFLTAVQAQAAWAWNHNSVLLASGLNNPRYGNTGSGIYAGRQGPLKTIFTDEKTTRLLVNQVPKNIEESLPVPETDGKFESSIKKLRPLKDHLHAFTTELLPEGQFQKEIKLCHDQFCCHFDLRTEATDASPSETGSWQPYRLLVWDGVRDFSGAATGGVQFCAVVACKDAADVRSCGSPIPDGQFKKVHFTKLQIRGQFESDDTMLLANTLNQSLQPLPADAFALSEPEADCGQTGTERCLNMELTKTQDDIQTFALYNRVFRRDASKPTHTKPRRGSVARTSTNTPTLGALHLGLPPVPSRLGIVGNSHSIKPFSVNSGGVNMKPSRSHLLRTHMPLGAGAVHF